MTLPPYRARGVRHPRGRRHEVALQPGSEVASAMRPIGSAIIPAAAKDAFFSPFSFPLRSATRGCIAVHVDDQIRRCARPVGDGEVSTQATTHRGRRIARLDEHVVRQGAGLLSKRGAKRRAETRTQSLPRTRSGDGRGLPKAITVAHFSLLKSEGPFQVSRKMGDAPDPVCADRLRLASAFPFGLASALRRFRNHQPKHPCTPFALSRADL